MTKIGFIGLGHMGLPMASCLINQGHEVCGFDLQASARQALIEKGGRIEMDLKRLAAEQDILITMLQTGEQVESVCLSEQGLFAFAKPNTLYIDCSSIAIESSHKLHHAAQQAHLLMLDAPVSGGVAGANAGTLTFMVGGDQKTLDSAKPLLQCMGKNIIHTGEAGSGQAAKICNNMILGISMIAISEAFKLAEHLGLSAEKLFEVANQSSGQCWAMSRYVPVPGILENVPANHGYQPGFSAAMMLKDLKLSQEAAQHSQLSIPLAALATSLYQGFNDQGHGQLDFSAIIKNK